MPRLLTIPRALSRLSLAALAAALLVLAGALAVHAQSLTFPPLSGRVVDQANIIDAASRERIAALLAAHEQKTSDQIVVASLQSLQGTAIEEVSNQLFRHWKLGQAKTSNGVLLLVAPNERKVRIEVGYGLEGTLTDAISKMIIQAAIAPKFKAGDYGGGLEAGVAAIISTLQGDGEWQERVKLRNAPQDDGYDAVVIILIFIMVIIVFQMLSSRSGPPGGGSHRSRRGNWIITSPGPFSGGGGGFSGGFGGGGGGGFSGGGGSSGGGGASGDW